MDKYDCTAYESELYHYGVPGMKWGEHRFQAKQSRYSSKMNKYNAKAASSKTGVGARYNIARANAYKNKKDLSSAYKNANGIGKKISVAVGHKRAEIINKNASTAYSKMKATAKHDLTKKILDANAKNAKTQSDYHKNVQKRSLKGKAVAGTLLDKEYRNLPIQKISGKHTTAGKRQAELLIANMALNIASTAIRNRTN